MECPLPQIAQLVFRRPHSIVPQFALGLLGPQGWQAALPIDLVCSWQLRSGGGGFPTARRPVLSPERTCRTYLAKRIVDAFFVRAPVDRFHHRKASDAFPPYNLN